MRMISIFGKSQNLDGPRPIAHLLRTPARLNRYPRISDAGGYVWKTSEDTLTSECLGVNLSATYKLSRMPCFWRGLVFIQPSLSRYAI